MQLISDMARSAGITPAQAESAAGTLLAAVEMSTPREMYAAIERVVPGARELALKTAPPLGGRTGEMRAYVAELKSDAGGARVAAQLTLQGLTPAQVSSVVETLVRFLQDRQGIKPVERLMTELPGLKRLLAGA